MKMSRTFEVGSPYRDFFLCELEVCGFKLVLVIKEGFLELWFEDVLLNREELQEDRRAQMKKALSHFGAEELVDELFEEYEEGIPLWEEV